MAKGGVRIPILSEFKPQGIDKAIKEFQKLETTSAKIGFGLQKAFVPALAVTAGLTAGFVKLSLAAETAATSNARIAQVATSMGLFGTETQKVTDRLIALAEATARQTGVDQNLIKETQAKLLTFKEIAVTADEVGGAFDRATQAAVDLAAAGFGEASTNAVQLGKALNDPIKGITALTRSGVTFTAAEQERIKVLVESNKIGEAQTMILEAIETQVGGTAAATANASDKMGVSFSIMQEKLGTALLPVFEKFTDIAIVLFDFIGRNDKVFLGVAAGVGLLAGAIVAANIAMKVHAGLQTVVKVANAVLGTSFQLTGAKIAKFAGGLAGVGVAIGAAVFVYQDYQRAKNRVKDLTAELVPLLQAEAGGFDALASKQTAAILASTENQKAIEALGLSTEQYFAFIKGEAVPELDFLRAAVEKGVRGVQDLGKQFGADSSEVFNFGVELNTMRVALGNAATESELMGKVTKETTAAVVVAERSLEDMTAAAEAVSEEMSLYRESLSKAIASTTAWRDALRDSARKGAESFNDFQVDAGTSIEEFRQSLLDSAANAYNWQNNLITVARTTSPEFARYLADMGVAGADLVASLAADEDEARRTMEAFELNAAVMARDVVAEFDVTAEGVKRRMADVNTAVRNGLPPSSDMRAKAMEIGNAIYAGIVDALNAGESNVAYAAAALADTAIVSGKRAIRASSPSRAAADEIGRPIAEGVALGIDDGARLASDSIAAMMDDVIAEGVDAARELVKTIEDEIGQIFSAIGARRSEERMLKRVTDAETDLADAKKNLNIITKGAGKDSEEYAKAQRDVQDAQWRLADANDRLFDSQDKVNKAQLDVTKALNEFGFGSPEWAEAIRTLDRENRNLEQAARTVQDREVELTTARQTSDSVLKGYTEDSLVYRDAVEQVEAAELKLKDANFDLLDSQAKLIEKGPQFEDQFRKIATAAGLEGTEIDKLIQKHKDLGAARIGQAQAEQQAAVIDQQTASIRAATPAPRPAPAPVPAVPRIAAPTAAQQRASEQAAAQFSPAAIAAASRPRVSRNIGGPVPGIVNTSMPIMAHGGEYVLSADVVDAIKRGAPSRGLGRGGPAGGGGGNVINITVTSADPQAVVQAIRSYNRTNGPAPIRVMS